MVWGDTSMRQKTTAPIRLLSILRNAMLSGAIDTSPTVRTTGVNSLQQGGGLEEIARDPCLEVRSFYK